MPKHKRPQQLVSTRDGELYRLIVMKVTATDPDRKRVGGHEVPRELSVIYDEEAAEIVGGEHFVTAYVPVSVFGMPPVKGVT
jgi:hypothetical protein